MKEKWVLLAKGADFEGLAQKFHIDPLTARLIRNRDVVGEEAVEKYLHGGFSQTYSPWLLKDMKTAVGLLLQKAAEKKPVRIIGDYDIDGVCAVYILRRGLRAVGIEADYDIPDRIADGYGINRRLIEKARQDGIDTIVTCDNGIAAAEEVGYAKEQGMTVIITDHHEVPFLGSDSEKRFILPPADAIINPKQQDCAYPYPGLCGAMVACKLVEALFEETGADKEQLSELLEFGAIATIGDVMDLTDENRIIVKCGLEQLHRTGHIGLNALFAVNRLKKEEISPYHIGFVAGPCLNASGRLDSAKRALALLEAEDPVSALRLAEDLKELNDSRKILTEQAVKRAIEMIETTDLHRDKVLVVYLPDCHESIAGIIAGRIREAYQKPAYVLTKGEQSLKGSGRSIPAYSMFQKLQACGDLLLHFGGHPMAAGLSLAEENLQRFRQRLNEECGLSEEDFAERVTIDAEMPISYISEKLVEEMALLEPFGKGNTRPLFAQKNLHIDYAELVGRNRNVLKMRVSDGMGTAMPAVCFQHAEQTLEYVRAHPWLTAAYYPQIQEFRGRRSLQLVITHYY